MNDHENSDIELILENIRYNCVVMSEQHKKRFLALKGVLRYFRIPIIILSGVNSVISVGLQPYLEQGAISIITCLVSLLCGIIGSIELYLSIQTQMENELITSKEYYLLSIDIYKCLSLKISNRSIDLKAFMEEKFASYQKLIEKSNIIVCDITDRLTALPGTLFTQDKSTSPPSTPLRNLFTRNPKQNQTQSYQAITNNLVDTSSSVIEKSFKDITPVNDIVIEPNILNTSNESSEHIELELQLQNNTNNV